ncbi:hypothetical protein QQ045_020239 [Rhodiola kirilowii]
MEDLRRGDEVTEIKKRRDKKASGHEVEEALVEMIFSTKEIPTWREQLTVVVSFVLGVLFSFIVMKLNLTTGINSFPERIRRPIGILLPMLRDYFLQRPTWAGALLIDDFFLLRI